jgi:hypothetical protein
MTKLRVLIDSSERPSIDSVDGLNFVLKQLRADNSVDIAADVIPSRNVTFEELIGVLLLARDEIQNLRAIIINHDNKNETWK